jgi:hypothetical protein
MPSAYAGKAMSLPSSLLLHGVLRPQILTKEQQVCSPSFIMASEHTRSFQTLELKTMQQDADSSAIQVHTRIQKLVIRRILHAAMSGTGAYESLKRKPIHLL